MWFRTLKPNMKSIDQDEWRSVEDSKREKDEAPLAKTSSPQSRVKTVTETERYENAMARFDAVNREDPNQEILDGQAIPKELLYAQRMSAWLKRHKPDASEVLRLAARSQHIARWEIPRSDYPMNRKGYHQWRTTLNRFHADRACAILAEVGYDKNTIKRVEGFLLKKRLKSDPEMQVLEDVICLVFLESYFIAFSKKYDKEKMIPVIQKTWKKMTPAAQRAALALDLPPEGSALIKAALEI